MKKTGNALWRAFEWLVRTVVGGILKLFRKELTEEQWGSFMQFVKFCLVGCSNALVLVIVSSAVIKICDVSPWDGELFGIRDFYLHLSTFIGFFAKVTNSYIWNRKFVFGNGEKLSFSEHFKAYFKLVLSYSVSLVLSFLLNILWKNIGLSDYLCNPLNEIITLPLNYLMNKFWAFR